MKKLFFILSITYIVVFLSYPSTTLASEASPDASFINSVEADITGDGLREYIRLEGKLLSNDSNYYHDTWLDITSPFSTSWNITLKGGYDPKITLLDLNHDQVQDIFYEVSSNEEKTTYVSKLYTWKEGNIKETSLPQQNNIQGKYIDDFKIALTLQPKEPPIKISIPNQSLAIKKGLYDKNGQVLNSPTAEIEPLHQYQPLLISESKGYGLKTIQQVKDISDNNIIGSVETLWYLKNKQWIILQIKWHEDT